MTVDRSLIENLIEALAKVIMESEDELAMLDRAIGDGDHGANMKRGFEAVLGQLDSIAAKELPDALQAVGMQLVMKVGGASGPLFGTLFMSLGKAISTAPDAGELAQGFATAIDAVKARGKSDVGCKTMLDVLAPVQNSLADGADFAAIRACASEAAAATVPMQATKGRASYLGGRSIGHMDPGSRSSQLMIETICDVLEARQ
jgi:dihydroxyacetone kinase-like protein